MRGSRGSRGSKSGKHDRALRCTIRVSVLIKTDTLSPSNQRRPNTRHGRRLASACGLSGSSTGKRKRTTSPVVSWSFHGIGFDVDCICVSILRLE